MARIVSCFTCCAEMDFPENFPFLRLPCDTLLVCWYSSYCVDGTPCYSLLSLWTASCGDGFFDVVTAYGAALLRFKGSVVQGPVPVNC